MSTEADLQRVLESYAAETPDGNDNAILEKWMAKFPQYASDLMEFAAERSHMSILSGSDLAPDQVRGFVEKGRKKFSSLLEDAKAGSSKVSSLIRTAEERGMDKTAFARAVGLSISLLIYLEKRRVLAATVPEKVVAAIAEAIGASSKAVRAYLELPRSAAGLNFKAVDRPAEVGQKDFAEAVRQDGTLSEDQKRSLLE